MNARKTMRSGRERGSMAVEVIIGVPVLFLFVLLIVAGGRVIQRQGEVDSAARDAARAASLERSPAAAAAAAQSSIAGNLQDLGCTNAGVDTDGFLPTPQSREDVSGAYAVTSMDAGIVTVKVSCEVPLRNIGLPGLPGSKLVSSQSSSPVDPYRYASTGSAP